MNEDNATAPSTNSEVPENQPPQDVISVETSTAEESVAPAETSVAPTENVTPAPIEQSTVIPQEPTPVTPTATVIQEQNISPAVNPISTNVGPQPTTSAKPKFSKSKWFLPAVLTGFLLLGGGAAAYLTVFKKTPESAWKSALANTANGIEKYLENSYDIEQKGFKIEGDFKISSPIVIDGSSEGQWYGSNGSLRSNIGASGARINMEYRTVGEEGVTPDLYIKVDGLEGVDDLVASLGGPEQSGYSAMLSSINDQWFFIDHTLIDQYTASTDSTSGLALTEEDTKEISNNVMAVLKDRMFSTQGDKAIFTIAETLGKEDFEGTSSFKMRVQLDKENFKAFVTALKDSIKDTKAEEILKTGNPDATLEEVLDFESLLKDIEEADFSKSADVWVEENGGFIRNVRFYPEEGSESTNYLDIGMNYTGGDLFPFQIKETLEDETMKGTVVLGLEVNQSNGDVGLSFDVNLDSDGFPLKAVGDLSIKGSNDEVKVEKPDGAKNIFELLAGFQQSLGLGATGMEGYDDSQLEDLYLDSEFDDTLPLDDFEL